MERIVRSRGFTLIELLVVIGIISVLASVILVNVQRAQERGNDAARLANLNDIRVALRLYAAANGHYPITDCQGQRGSTYSWTWVGYGGFWSPAQGCAAVGGVPTAGTLETMLAPYISQPVKDPTNALSPLSTDAGYLYIGDGTSYCLMAYRVPQNMLDFPKETWNMALNRCGSVNASGQCTSGVNSIYYAQGPTWAGGC